MKQFVYVKDNSVEFKIIVTQPTFIDKKQAAVISWNYNDDKIQVLRGIIGNFLLLSDTDFNRVYKKFKEPIFNTEYPVVIRQGNNYIIVQEGSEENIWLSTQSKVL